MSLKQSTLVQYRFYIAEKGLAPLANDANAYLQKIDPGRPLLEVQTIKNGLAQVQDMGGRVPLCDAEDKLDADHAVIAHFYRDTYILELIANAKRETEWKRLNESLRFDNAASSLGKTILLFLGEVPHRIGPSDKDEVLQSCRNMGISNPLLWWCLLEAGFFVQLSNTEFALVSPEKSEEEVEDFALNIFPRMMMYQLKASFQKAQYDYLAGLMEGKEIDQQPGMTEQEASEWQRHRGIIPAIERETNEAVVFVTEEKAKIQTIGSREARELTLKLRNLRLSYARLAKAMSDAEMMLDTVCVNIKNYLDLTERLNVKKAGGLIANNQRIQENMRETLSHSLLRHKAAVERTRNVLDALSEYAQELRDLQSQEEVRLQSIQTSLIAAIASL